MPGIFANFIHVRLVEEQSAHPRLVVIFRRSTEIGRYINAAFDATIFCIGNDDRFGYGRHIVRGIRIVVVACVAIVFVGIAVLTIAVH